MKNINLKILLSVFVFISFMACGQKESPKQGENDDQAVISLISPEDLSKINKDAQLIDVRQPREFASGHLENAVNMNLYSGDFEKQIMTLDKNKEVYLYCLSGVRSASAAKKLKKMGFVKIYDLQGGLSNWNKQQYPITKD
jgi:rhodanese-related sulfurtransferase